MTILSQTNRQLNLCVMCRLVLPTNCLTPKPPKIPKTVNGFSQATKVPNEALTEQASQGQRLRNPSFSCSPSFPPLSCFPLWSCPIWQDCHDSHEIGHSLDTLYPFHKAGRRASAFLWSWSDLLGKYQRSPGRLWSSWMIMKGTKSKLQLKISCHIGKRGSKVLYLTL